MFNMRQVTRVTVDPNGVVANDPRLSAAFFEDASRLPSVGEVVLAVQDEDQDRDFIGTAVVERIDYANRLIYLRVDWRSFVVEGAMTSGHASPSYANAAAAQATRSTAAAGMIRLTAQ